MIGFPLPGTTPSTTPEPGGAPVGEAAPAGLFAGLLAGLAAPTMDIDAVVQSIDTEGETGDDGPTQEDSDGRQDAGPTLHALLSGGLAVRTERAPTVDMSRTEIPPSTPVALPDERSTAGLEASVVSDVEPEARVLRSTPTVETDPTVARPPSEAPSQTVRTHAPVPSTPPIESEAGGRRSSLPIQTAPGADAVDTPPTRLRRDDVGAMDISRSVEAPPTPGPSAFVEPDLAGIGERSSVAPVAGPVAASTSGVDAGTRPVPVDLVDRVIRAVELQRNQPPPRAVAVELPELEGLRIIVSLRMDGTIHVAPVVPNGTTSPTTAFVDAVSDALIEHGFQLADDSASDRRHRGNADPERPRAGEPGQRGTRPRTRARNTSNDLRL